ncbi:MAG TPA: copper resistance protein CopC [Jatrophihabitans sp.]|jgi:copper transport protein|uniref:copper resistance CopC/CopD family protein n=1 Tax=Jatrophihabitans sp. TaxID=1932789 RepID=UPI002DF75FF3|nr:copper resistance protein CopC [Jatrophihabitans sp.]
MSRSLGRRLAGAALLAGLAVLLSPASPASAHAYLVSSSPADGSTVTTPPRTLTLHFSESVELAATRIELADSAGRHVGLGALRISKGESTEDPSAVVAELPALARGAYRVSWATLSSDDLHQTRGVFLFGVNHAVHATPFNEPVPRPEEAALRWALFLASAGALGGLVAAAIRRRRGSAGWRRPLVPAAAAAGAGLLVAAGLLLDQAGSGGESLGRLVSSGYGARWALRELGLALIALAALVARREARARIAAMLGIVGAGATGVGAALLGHADAAGTFSPTRVAADAAHLLAAAAWCGMLLFAVAGVLAARRRPGGERVARNALLGYAGPAAACVSVMLATGIYLASGVVGSVDAAVLTLYGRALLLKILIFAAAAVAGLVNHRRLRRAGAALPVRTLVAEAVLLTLALAAAAVLTSGQPAREPEFVAAPRLAIPSFVDGRAGDLQETLRLGPNRVGPNVAAVDIYDTRRPAPAPIHSVSVRVTGVDQAPGPALTATNIAGTRTWTATVPVVAAGRSVVEIAVTRAGLPAVTTRFAWTVAAAMPRVRPATVSTTPIAGSLRTLAAAVAVVLAIGWGAFGRRRRRAPGHPEVESPERAREPAGIS